jgi:hypothetical protein
MAKGMCAEPGCSNPAGREQRHRCPACYRDRRISVFLATCEFATSGCWLWTGSRYTGGYGKFFAFGRERAAHRVSYEFFVGPIPEGLALDHLCRVRRCVNPDHLEPVTYRENTLRSPVAHAALNAAKTHCKHGHEFTPENTRITTGGRRSRRRCRECERLRHARQRLKRR